MRRLVLLLFFLSGALGLVYEVVWSRTLTHVFGSTAVAVGTVLAASWALDALASADDPPAVVVGEAQPAP